MKKMIVKLTKKVFQLKEWEKPYKNLRKHLDYKPEPLETIFKKGTDSGISIDKFQTLLDDLDIKGSIFAKQVNGEKHYYLAPLAVGMYEH